MSKQQVKQALIARLSRTPSNMDAVRSALDKLDERELIALHNAVRHLDQQVSHLKRRVLRF